MPGRRFSVLAVLALGAPAALVALALLWPSFGGTARADHTGFRSPTALHAPTNWTAPDRAFSSGDGEAEEITDGDEQGYSEFAFPIPSGAIILGIAVQLEAFSEDTSGCELDVRLSGDDGTGYSSPQTAALTNIETVHTLGGSTDLWGESWGVAQFADDEFVAKVTYVDPGGGCDDGSRASLDHIQVNVYFKTAEDSGLHSPTLLHAPNGDWSGASNAFTNNGVYATSDTDDDDQGYADFNFVIPPVSIITGIEVLAEARSADAMGCELQIRLSGDDGANVTVRKTAPLTSVDTVHTLGGGDDLWGETWTPGNFTDANFVVEVRNNDPGAGCTDPPETFLDHIQVRVYFKEVEQTGKASPSASHAPNDWTSPDNAFTSNNVDATSTAGGDEQGYAGFGLVIPVDSVITGIAVQAEATSDDASGCSLEVELSGDDGQTYSDARSAALTNVEAVHTLGGIDDTWGNTWSVTNFSDANFVLKVANVDPGAGCDPPNTSLDHVRVNVYYKDVAHAGFTAPSATQVPNDWTTPDEAFVSDNNDATSTTNGDEQGYGDFGFNVPTGAIITGIEVRAEAFSEDTSGCELHIRLSWDGGDTFSSARIAALTNVETVHALGGTSDTWGRSWSAADFTDANFHVKVTNVDPGGACDPPSTSLDLLQVNVYWKPAVPLPTATRTPTRTPTRTNTPTITGTPTRTGTPTITSTPTITATRTITNTPLASDTPTHTPTRTRTNTPVPSSTPTRTATLTKPLGDVNDDGFVNSIDSLFILQRVARLLTTLPNAASADVNRDGEITSVDAALILQLDAGLIDSFG